MRASRAICFSTLALVILSACNVTKADPATFRSRRVVLASFYGQRSIDATALGPQGLVQGINTWGEEVIDQLTPQVITDLQQGLDAEFIPPADAQKAAAFAALKRPVPVGPNDLHAAPGMVMVDISRDNHANLGALARELNADAAMVIFQTHGIERPRDAPGQQALTKSFTLVVDATGNVLFFDLVKGSSGEQPGSVEQMTTDMLRLVSKGLSQAMVKESSLNAVHAFILRWRVERLLKPAAPGAR